MLKDDMIDDFKKIRAATIQKPDQSFVAKGMHITYDAAEHISAVTIQFDIEKGMIANRRLRAHAARVKVIREKITSTDARKSLFIEVGGLAKDDFSKKSKQWGEQVEVILNHARKELLADFDRRFAMVDEDVKPEDTQVAEQLRQAVEEDLEVVNGELAGYVKAWKGY